MSFDFSNAELPGLKPLAASFAATEVEADLKRLFLDIFQTYLSARAFDANVLGATHLGSFDLVRKSVNVDGLVLLPGEREEAATRYLYRAWKSANVQGRGLHFLRTYLQMLFPNIGEVAQMMQDKAAPYPTALSEAVGHGFEPGRFLTSRLRITVNALQAGVVDRHLTRVIESSMPARMVPYFRTHLPSFDYLVVAAGSTALQVSRNSASVVPRSSFSADANLSVASGSAGFQVARHAAFLAPRPGPALVGKTATGSAFSVMQTAHSHGALSARPMPLPVGRQAISAASCISMIHRVRFSA